MKTGIEFEKQGRTLESVVVIIHKGSVFDNRYYSSIDQARNNLKFRFPKKRWKEPEENTFVCANHGTKFQIIELKYR